MRQLDVRAATLLLFSVLGTGVALVLQRCEVFRNPELAPVCTISMAIGLGILWLNRSSVLARQLREQKKNPVVIENLLDVHVRRLFSSPVLLPPILYLGNGLLWRVLSGGYTRSSGRHIRKVLAGSECWNTPGGLILFGIGVIVSDFLEFSPVATTAKHVGIPLILYAVGCLAHLYLRYRCVHSGRHEKDWEVWKKEKWITNEHYAELRRNATMWREALVGGSGASRNLSIQVRYAKKNQSFTSDCVVYASQLARACLTSGEHVTEMEVVPKFPGLGANVTALVNQTGKTSHASRSVVLGPGVNSKEFQSVWSLHLSSQRSRRRLLAFIISEDVHVRTKKKTVFIRDDVVFDEV